MDDVAQRANVSKSTVSLVLNNRPGVSEEMRERVLAAAEAVGYKLPSARPSANAVLDPPPAIALVHFVNDDPDVDPGLTHLYLSYRNGIQRFTQGQDISVMLVTGYQDGDENSLSYQLLSQEERIFDGLILMGPGLHRNGKLLKRVLDEQIPAVILGRSWFDLPISSVSQHHAEQAGMMMDHLIGLGHQHIGFVAREIDRGYAWFNWRFQAYREKMAHHFGHVNENLIVIENDLATAVSHLLQKEPSVTALFCLNDHIANLAMETAVSNNYRIPTDLSIAGIDGTIKAAEGLPKLTTMTFPHEEVGYLAAELVVKQLQNKKLNHAHIFVRSTLIKGASCTEPPSAQAS
jgi:LacI family transcriptional regulator